jgi:hypothetical protein
MEPSQDKKVNLNHDGKYHTTLRTNDLKHCLVKNSQLGVTLTKNGNKNTLSFAKNEISFTDEQFAPYENFLQQLCFLIESAKLHYQDFDRNMTVHHLDSFAQIVNSPHKDDFMQVLNSGLETLNTVFKKVYGNENVKLLVTKFVQAATSLPKLDHGRILADADEGTQEGAAKNLGLTSEDYAYPIRVIFAVVFFLTILYTAYYLYNMEVHRDSLIYCKF